MEPWQQYEATLTPEQLARRRAFRADLEARVRKTAEGDDGRKFRDHDLQANAAALGGDVLGKFNAAVDAMTSGGIDTQMARIVAATLHLPSGNTKPSTPNTEQSTGDAGRLTDAERAALLALLPARSKHSSARVTDSDMVDVIDRLLFKRRHKLRARDMESWPTLKARVDQLVLRGAFEAITDALDSLDFADARKRELRNLCDGMSKRKVRLASLKAERAKAGRY